MSDFSDMVARAVSPTMSRDEREAVYRIVKEAVVRLQQGEDRPATDPGVVLQQHLVEETIRDVEAEIVRYTVLKSMAEASAAASADPEE